MNKKILISGSLAYDKIMNFSGRFADHILPDRIHDLNISLAVNEIRENFGGCAGNIAYNLALLGLQPVIIACAGHDFSRYRDWLNKHAVDISKVTIDENEPTAAAHIVTDEGNNQFTIFHSGALKTARPISNEDVDDQAVAIVAPSNTDDMAQHARLYRELGVRYIFDPGQMIPALSVDALRDCILGAYILICNDYELSLILKKTGMQKSTLIGSVAMLVTTLGAKGSVIESERSSITIPPAKPRNTSDPTGAGDAYRAGFIAGLVHNLNTEQCGRLGSAVAVYTVEKYGTQTHHFTAADVEERYFKNFGDRITIH